MRDIYFEEKKKKDMCVEKMKIEKKWRQISFKFDSKCF